MRIGERKGKGRGGGKRGKKKSRGLVGCSPISIASSTEADPRRKREKERGKRKGPAPASSSCHILSRARPRWWAMPVISRGREERGEGEKKRGVAHNGRISRPLSVRAMKAVKKKQKEGGEEEGGKLLNRSSHEHHPVTILSVRKSSTRSWCRQGRRKEEGGGRGKKKKEKKERRYLFILHPLSSTGPFFFRISRIWGRGRERGESPPSAVICVFGDAKDADEHISRARTGLDEKRKRKKRRKRKKYSFFIRFRSLYTRFLDEPFAQRRRKGGRGGGGKGKKKEHDLLWVVLFRSARFRVSGRRPRPARIARIAEGRERKKKKGSKEGKRKKKKKKALLYYPLISLPMSSHRAVARVEREGKGGRGKNVGELISIRAVSPILCRDLPRSRRGRGGVKKGGEEKKRKKKKRSCRR